MFALLDTDDDGFCSLVNERNPSCRVFINNKDDDDDALIFVCCDNEPGIVLLLLLSSSETEVVIVLVSELLRNIVAFFIVSFVLIAFLGIMILIMVNTINTQQTRLMR